MNSFDYTGPCRIDCPLKCEVPDGVRLSEVPRPRHKWPGLIHCVNGECTKSFLVEKLPIGDDANKSLTCSCL